MWTQSGRCTTGISTDSSSYRCTRMLEFGEYDVTKIEPGHISIQKTKQRRDTVEIAIYVKYMLKKRPPALSDMPIREELEQKSQLEWNGLSYWWIVESKCLVHCMYVPVDDRSMLMSERVRNFQTQNAPHRSYWNCFCVFITNYEKGSLGNGSFACSLGHYNILRGFQRRRIFGAHGDRRRRRNYLVSYNTRYEYHGKKGRNMRSQQGWKVGTTLLL